jgi:hypothetical protein
MSFLRIAGATVVGMAFGTVVCALGAAVCALVVNYCLPWTVATSRSLGPGGIPVNLTEVVVPDAVLVSPLIGSIARGLVGCALAIRSQIRQQKRLTP